MTFICLSHNCGGIYVPFSLWSCVISVKFIGIHLLLCLGSSSCFMTSFFLDRWPHIWLMNPLINRVVYGRHNSCQGPVAAKQAQIITHPPPCLRVGMTRSCHIWFSLNLAMCHVQRSSLWCGHCSTVWFVQMEPYVPNMCCHFSREEAVSWQVILVHSFSKCPVRPVESKM